MKSKEPVCPLLRLQVMEPGGPMLMNPVLPLLPRRTSEDLLRIGARISTGLSYLILTARRKTTITRVAMVW